MADWHDPSRLEDALDLLESRDFIRREATRQIEGDREYSFKHMLIGEVAYTTLPGAARRNRHAAVARLLTSAAGERMTEAAALLAHHWREAGEDDRARESLIMAAEHAAQGWAKHEAVHPVQTSARADPAGPGRPPPRDRSAMPELAL